MTNPEALVEISVKPPIQSGEADAAVSVVFERSHSRSPDLSIVVPVFNVEAYIEECLRSFEHVTRISRQVVIVDDGSTDNSLAIARSWAVSQRNVSVLVVTQKNGWLSKARNTGARIASGEYVAFLDGDDFYHPGAHELMVEFAKIHDCDIVLSRAAVFDNVTNQVQDFYDAQIWNAILEKRRGLVTSVHRDPRILALEPNANVRAVRRSFMAAANLVFREDIRFNEDQPVHHRSLLRAERVGLIDATGLFYRVNRPGQFSRAVNRDRFDMLVGARSSIADAKQTAIHASGGAYMIQALQRMIFWCGTMTPWDHRRRYFEESCEVFAMTPEPWFVRYCQLTVQSRDVIITSAFRTADIGLLLRVSSGRPPTKLTSALTLLKTCSSPVWIVGVKFGIAYGRALLGRVSRLILTVARSSNTGDR